MHSLELRHFNKDKLLLHTTFLFVKKSLVDLTKVNIYGTHRSHEIEYFQMDNFSGKYSVVLTRMEKYQPNFGHIHIRPDSVLSLYPDYDLEWNDFNKIFDNKFKNPRQALEVLSPTFMEELVALRNTYHEIEIEYFEDKNYHTHTLAVIVRGYLIEISDSEREVQESVEKIMTLLDNVITLKESI